MTDERSIVAVLVDVMRDIGPVSKGDWNAFHKYSFRGIDRVLDATAPALRAHGVLTVPRLHRLSSRDVTTDKGARMREVTLEVDYEFSIPGDALVVRVPGEASDTSDKAVSKAMSVAYRTALIQLFAIATGEPDAHSTGTDRGRDPMEVAIETVQTLASSKGWSMDGLAHDFETWSDGDDIRKADLKTLTAYIETLDPPPKTTRVARKKTGGGSR